MKVIVLMTCHAWVPFVLYSHQCIQVYGSGQCLYLDYWSYSPDVDIQYIGGADPEMVFLDKDYNEVEVSLCLCAWVYADIM